MGHSPGTWKATLPRPNRITHHKRSACGTHLPAIENDRGNLLAHVCEAGPHTAANAALLGAAKELLEALEEITELFEWSESGSAEERAYDKARAAIAKAKG